MDSSTSLDSNSLAKAVEQATQAQQAQQHLHQPSPPLQSISSSGIDNLVCQWQGCGERLDNAENLYDHVCERHVGRKSTNNLNLTCAWGACRTTTVKRDHITSHIRVHVPLKPHKCDFCGKAFKRPQDLKKHVKTHADDSVLMNSPQPSHNRSHASNHHSSKTDASSLNIAEAIQAYMANPRSGMMYGENNMPSSYPSYSSGMTTGPDNYGQPTSQYAAYGSVSYPNNSAMADIQSMDTRRRAIEALNDFLGDIKRRALNPNNYYDVGQRLQSNALPLPIATGNGYNMGYNSSNGGTTAQNGYSNSFSNSGLMDIFNHAGMGNNGGVSAPMSQQGYSLPIPNARTKNDLQDIDRFLEQLQATVYESSNSAAAAGVQQAGVHTTFPDFTFGSSNNHYRTHSPTTHSTSSGLGSISSSSGLPVSSASLDTPALTPASVSSYSSSGQSPLSSAGRSSAGNGLYPSLPSVTGISDMGSGYPSTTSAPASGLATGFDDLDGRRYSGGRLQRQAPADASADVEMTDEQDGAATPRPDDAKTPKAETSIDPALREEDKMQSESAVTSSSSSDGDDKRQEEWVENIRVIEALRKWISTRLKNGEYDEQTAENNDDTAMKDDDAGDNEAKAVETAKMAEEQMAEVLAQHNAEHDKKTAAAEAVEYPSLPS